MARPPGRDQAAPMERLVRLVGVLTAHPRGAPVELLLKAQGTDGTGATDEARRRMLGRDLEQLNRLGYDIRNLADTGQNGLYLMRARDNRLQVHLSAEQRGELLRAALAAQLHQIAGHLGTVDPAGRPASSTSIPEPGPDNGALDLVQRATTRRCLVRFVYKGEPRLVHPHRVHSGPSGWYLAGREEGAPDGQAVVKEFVVSRMSEVTLEAPGTAEPVSGETRPSLDPLSWLVDVPTEVTIAVPPEHRLLVENLLGEPAGADTSDPESSTLTYVVTNRAVFRWRVYELGTRVRVLGPADVREELLAELDAYLAGPA